MNEFMLNSYKRNTHSQCSRSGPDAPLLASGAHIQAVLVRFRRRPREDCSEEFDANRRVVHGRLEEVLSRCDVHVAREEDVHERG